MPLEARSGSHLSSWAPPLAPTRESMEPITVLVWVILLAWLLCMQLKKFGKQINWRGGLCVLPLLWEPQIEYPHGVFTGWVFISLGWYFWSQFGVPHYSNRILCKHKSATVNTLKEFLGICHLDFSQIMPAVMNRLWSASETVATLNNNNTVWHLNWS